MNKHQRFVEGQERKGRYTNTKEKEPQKPQSAGNFHQQLTSPNTVRWFLAMKRGKPAKNDTLYTNIVHNKKDLGIKGDNHKQSLKERAL